MDRRSEAGDSNQSSRDEGDMMMPSPEEVDLLELEGPEEEERAESPTSQANYAIRRFLSAADAADPYNLAPLLGGTGAELSSGDVIQFMDELTVKESATSSGRSPGEVLREIEQIEREMEMSPGDDSIEDQHIALIGKEYDGESVPSPGPGDSDDDQGDPKSKPEGSDTASDRSPRPRAKVTYTPTSWKQNLLRDDSQSNPEEVRPKIKDEFSHKAKLNLKEAEARSKAVAEARAKAAAETRTKAAKMSRSATPSSNPSRDPSPSPSLPFTPRQLNYSPTDTTKICGKDFISWQNLFLQEREKCNRLANILEAREDSMLQSVIEHKRKSDQEIHGLMEKIRLLKESEAKWEVSVAHEKMTQENLSRTIHRIKDLEEELRRQTRMVSGYQIENERYFIQVKALKEEVKMKDELLFKERAAYKRSLTIRTQPGVKQFLPTSVSESDSLIRCLQSQLSMKNEASDEFKASIVRLEEKVGTLMEALDQEKQTVSRHKEVLGERNKELSETKAVLDGLRMGSEGKLRCMLREKDKLIETTRRELNSSRDHWTKINSDLNVEVNKLRQDAKLKEVEIRNLKKKTPTSSRLGSGTGSYSQLAEYNKKVEFLQSKVKKLESELCKRTPDGPIIYGTESSDSSNKFKSSRTMYLESRVRELENMLDEHDDKTKEQYRDLQEEFQRYKEKREGKVMDVTSFAKETQIPSPAPTPSPCPSPTRLSKHHSKSGSAGCLVRKAGPLPGLPKSRADPSLLSTIRKQKQDILSKEKEIHLLKKELEVIKKSHNKLQKEHTRLQEIVKDMTKIDGLGTTDEKVAALQHQLKVLAGKMQLMKDQHYDRIARLEEEKKTIGEIAAKKYGTSLQEKYESELLKLKAEYAARFSATRTAELEDTLEKYKEELAALEKKLRGIEARREKARTVKGENQMLHKANADLRKRVQDLKRLMTPGAKAVEKIQEHLDNLDSRFMFREEQLQLLVRAFHNRGSKGPNQEMEEAVHQKTRELAAYRLKLDAIIGTIQELVQI